MLTASEIRDRIRSVLCDDMSISDFVVWLSAASWELPEDSPLEVQDLVDDIDLFVAEYTNRHRTHEGLLGELRLILTNEYVTEVDLVGSRPAHIVEPSDRTTESTYSGFSVGSAGSAFTSTNGMLVRRFAFQ